jgi:hypothetical protein
VLLPPAAPRGHTKKVELNYPVLFGNQRTADQYYVKGLPASIFIDRNGRITDQVPGGASRSFLENEIQLALENGTQATAINHSYTGPSVGS